MFEKLRVWYLSTKTNLFPGASRYWNNRYESGGNSGSGSRGESLRQKCRIINAFIQTHQIKSILDSGCGDGAVAACLNVNSYLGVDVSSYIVERNSQLFAKDSKKKFRGLNSFSIENNKFDLALSLDVIFHIVNLEDLNKHLKLLFNATGKWVIISSTNYDSPQ
ncbi:MAG: class I SAM-dependent methyltransferase, partial [Saprospiraceae bacterium]|nr:class I SAM-dependent methyltransferase [Saprospiraceae bacterium]